MMKYFTSLTNGVCGTVNLERSALALLEDLTGRTTWSNPRFPLRLGLWRTLAHDCEPTASSAIH